MVDMFNEKYVYIDGKELFGDDDIQIFAKKRGNVIFRVSLVPGQKFEDENVYTYPWIRYAIIEIGKDDDGYAIVKDYMWFDVEFPDDEILTRAKEEVKDNVFSEFIDVVANGFSGIGNNTTNVKNTEKSNEIGYF